MKRIFIVFMLLLTSLPMLQCGSEWCDFEIVTVERNAIVKNLTTSTIKIRYCINRNYENTCCKNEKKIPSSDFKEEIIELNPGNSFKWTYSYWDSIECAQSIIVSSGDEREIDTLYLSIANINKTILWPIDTSFFRYETKGWVRWEANSGTIIYDTLIFEQNDSLSYTFR